MQEGGAGLPAKVQHLSQNGYSLSLSLPGRKSGFRISLLSSFASVEGEGATRTPRTLTLSLAPSLSFARVEVKGPFSRVFFFLACIGWQSQPATPELRIEKRVPGMSESRWGVFARKRKPPVKGELGVCTALGKKKLPDGTFSGLCLGGSRVPSYTQEPFCSSVRIGSVQFDRGLDHLMCQAAGTALGCCPSAFRGAAADAEAGRGVLPPGRRHLGPFLLHGATPPARV